MNTSSGGTPHSTTLPSTMSREHFKKRGQEFFANCGLYIGTLAVAGRDEVKTQIPVLQPPLDHRHIPLAAVKKHERVDVPREEIRRLNIIRLLERILHQGRVVRASPFRRSRKLYFPRKHRRLTPFAKNAQVRPPVISRSILLNLGVRKRPVRMRGKQRVRPGFDICAESDLVLAHFMQIAHAIKPSYASAFIATALRAAIWPVQRHSALFPPPLYIQPQNEPNSPALYRRGMGWSNGSTTWHLAFLFGPP